MPTITPARQAALAFLEPIETKPEVVSLAIAIEQGKEDLSEEVRVLLNDAKLSSTQQVLALAAASALDYPQTLDLGRVGQLSNYAPAWLRGWQLLLGTTG